MSTTLDLINAISSGKASEIETAFNEVFAEKVASGIDNFRAEIASNLFKPATPATEE